MGKYFKIFNTHSLYQTYISGSNKVLPNVSYCEDNNECHYNSKSILVAKFNVTDTSSATKLLYTSCFSEMEVDGVVLSRVTNYRFDTLGEHTVKYTLSDPTTIAYNAFKNCTNLTSITIPNSVTHVYGAFSGCTSLPVENDIRYAGTCAVEAVDKTKTTYALKEGTRFIGYDTFENCTNLTSITIPNSIIEIGSGAFENCTNLTSITIPNTITLINSYTFYGCSSLANINIPNGVTSIGDYAFYNCSSLTSITIPNGVTNIGTLDNLGGYTFYGCSSLTNINIPNSVTTICKRAFQGCTSLPVENDIQYADTCAVKAVDTTKTTYTLKEGTRFIHTTAFYNCSSLTNINIPNSVTIIDESVFHNCSSLTNINIPNSVTRIETMAFYNCSGLTSITIPSNVTYIANNAFGGCDNITSVTLNSNAIVSETYTKNSTLGQKFGQTPEFIIGGTVTSIGKYAFYNRSYITSITICNGVTSIEDYAFQNCTNLTSITIPNTVTSVSNSTFSGCTSLPVENDIMYADTYAVKAVDTTKTTYTLKEGTRFIGYNAFSSCSGLTSITIPSGVTTIGDFAFYQCTNMISINIPSSVINIGFSAISNCSSLTSIIIPSSVTTIDQYAFSSCSSLTSITIPSSVTTINNAAFSGCSGLTSITVDSNNATYDSRDNCNAIIETSTNKLIAGCQNTVIPNTVTTIGQLAFNGCSGLTSINIPNSVTTIGDAAFQNCSGLTSITIPNSVTDIGRFGFSNCSSLETITSLATTAPTIVSVTFQNVKTNGALYVPTGSDYSIWMGTGNDYLGKYNWTKVEQ